MQLIYYLLNNVRKVGEFVLPELLVPSASLAPSFLYSFTFLVSSNFLSIFIVFMFSAVLLSLCLSSFHHSMFLLTCVNFIHLLFFNFFFSFLYGSFLCVFFSFIPLFLFISSLRFYISSCTVYFSFFFHRSLLTSFLRFTCHHLNRGSDDPLIKQIKMYKFLSFHP
jgi:hypothetical protein